MKQILLIALMIVGFSLQAQVPYEPAGYNHQFYQYQIYDMDCETREGGKMEDSGFATIGISKYRKYLTIGSDEVDIQHQFIITDSWYTTNKDGTKWKTLKVTDYDGNPAGKFSYEQKSKTLHWEYVQYEMTGLRKCRWVLFMSKKVISDYL